MNVGIIGSGVISDIYLENMIHKFEQTNVIAIASKHIENARKKAEKFNIIAQNVEELIHNPEIELIVNLTPVGAHYEIIKAALLAGKHVYTEKTLTDNLESAKELVELAEEKGLVLCSAPDTFMGAAYQTARHAIDAGLIGEVNSFVISSNRDNRILLSFLPFLREPGAGVLFDYAVYYITALVSLLGPVSRVAGIAEAPYKSYTNIIPQSPEYGQEIKTKNESRASAIIMLKNGISGTAHFDCNSLMAEQVFFAIYGTEGILYLTDPNQFGGEVKLIPNTMNPMEKTESITLWNYSGYSGNERGIGPSDCIDSFINGKRPRASKEMAYHVFEVLDALLKGGEQGQFMDISSTCERPDPMPIATVPITNIGHTSFNAKNMKEMLYFYSNILGMERKFTLRTDDLMEMMKKSGDVPSEIKESLHKMGNKPWIEYLKLADRQYIEFFHDLTGSKQPFLNREEYYGYQKLNFEVDDIEKIKELLKNAGVEIKKDIKQVVDGALEIEVHDPDGNIVQFTQYAKEGLIPLNDKDNHEVCSQVKFTTQVAYQVKDAINMRNFYTQGLGLPLVKTLTYGDLASYLELEDAEKESISRLKMVAKKSWIDYIEVAPHQYIELFYQLGDPKMEERNLSDYFNYQHLCLEVSDIYEARKAIVKNGLELDTDINMGADGAYQLWIVDPDGNRIELMQYTKYSKQL